MHIVHTSTERASLLGYSRTKNWRDQNRKGQPGYNISSSLQEKLRLSLVDPTASSLARITRTAT